MFNSKYKKEAIRELERAVDKYKNLSKKAMNSAEELYKIKEEGIELLRSVENAINSIAKKPKEIETQMNKIAMNIRRFDNEILEIKDKYKNANVEGGTVAGVGVASGAAVAAFAPTAAMAIATTFGTASTGTAIATLSGAAATNAALAWIGGGALAAGGGGMVAGEALLALAGPVGWAIGAVGICTGGFLASSRNRKAAEKAEDKTYTIKKDTNRLAKIEVEINGVKIQINNMKDIVVCEMDKLSKNWVYNYSKATDEQKGILGRLVNESEALATKINEKLKSEV